MSTTQYVDVYKNPDKPWKGTALIGKITRLSRHSWRWEYVSDYRFDRNYRSYGFATTEKQACMKLIHYYRTGKII